MFMYNIKYYIVYFRGNDFRKDFSRIGSDLLARFTYIPIMVFTDAQTYR